MRTIKLTFEQLDLLIEALGIAENTYRDVFENTIMKYRDLRNNGTPSEITYITDVLNRKVNMLINLNQSLNDGELDV